MKISPLAKSRMKHPRITTRLFPPPPSPLSSDSSAQKRKPEIEIVDLRDRVVPPRLFLGHGAKYWTLWILGAAVAAIWLGPLLAELANRFVVKLW